MITISENILNALSTPARRINARVELYNCSTLQGDGYNRELLDTFCGDGALIDFKVERIADDGKFFGFGICQKLTVNLRDKERAINIHKGQVLEVSFGIDGQYTYPCALFQVEEVSRDENNNDLKVVAYDFLYKAGEHRVSELNLTEYTPRSFIAACAFLLNLPIKIEVEDPVFDLPYPTGANFEGSETLREALNAVAEATQSIFFVDWDWRLTFRRLKKDGEPVLHIDKSKYFELTNKTERTLAAICHATELGDNVEASTGNPGVVQYIRNNAFWELRDDIDTLLNNALAATAGITISQFDCSWRGNYALEIGDKITLETKNGDTLTAYVLNDTLSYNGGLREQTEWNFTEHNAETASNPVNLGDALRQTFARVNKAEGYIELVAKNTEDLQDSVVEEIASIRLQADSIASEVERVETKFDGAVQELNSTIEQTAESITSTVTAVDKKVDDSVTTLQSKIEQTNSSITSTVSRVDQMGEDINTIESQIQQNADNIELKVSKDNIISAINLSTEAIDISADKLNLNGYVTVSDLEGNGTTTINGSNITTGTISAERINMTGAIDWSDLSQSCRNTVASYAGADGADAELPDYIKSTYIDSTIIKSPVIQGGALYAGNVWEGYCQMTSSGLNIVNDDGSNVCGIGWYPGKNNLPYVVLGAGVDSTGTDQGLIKKYTRGVWVGDSDSLFDTNEQRPTSGTGIFIDFWDNKIYKYIDGTSSGLDAGADYVVETGTSEKWTYRKWNSGIAECWCKISVTATINTAWGALYSSGALTATNLALPFTFAEAPVVNVSCHNNGAGVFIMAAGNWGPPSTGYTGLYELCRGTSSASTSYGLSYQVKGRWK